MKLTGLSTARLTAGKKNEKPFYMRVYLNIQPYESPAAFAERYISYQVLANEIEGTEIDMNNYYFVVEALGGVGSSGEIIAHSRDVPEYIMSLLTPSESEE